MSNLESNFLNMVKNNERVIYKVCSFYISDEFPIQDLYQDVVCNLWSAYPKFRNECSESTWIYKIALNTCISALRKQKNQKRVAVSIIEETMVEMPKYSFEISELYTLIYKLNKIEKALILLYLEDKTHQEISDITGFTVANVATKLKRIRVKLKEMSNS